MVEKIFIINKFLTLKLEGKETHIYISGKSFRQCKFLLIEISKDDIGNFDEIKSIDAAAEKLDHSFEPRNGGRLISSEVPPEEAFWGHCSNLQVWAENNYNSKFLHANLAFPLLRELTKMGDSQASRVFKEEIVKRYNSGIETVRQFLRMNGYLKYLSMEEYLSLLDSQEERDVVNYLISIYPKLGRSFINKIDIKMGRISRIQLKGLKLEKVVEGLQYLTSLEELDLSYNPLKELPKWIDKFKKLRMLRINNCEIKVLPKEIGLLNNLHYLYASSNYMETLPETIGDIKSLRLLELNQNNLEKLPESICYLENLEILRLKENKLNALPENIGKLRKLQNLTISKNLVHILPLSIGKLKSLTHLGLSFNELTTLPASVGKLEKLEAVNVSHNPLINLDKSIYLLPNLQSLWLKNVPVEKSLIKKSNFKNLDVVIEYQKRKTTEDLERETKIEENRLRLELEEAEIEKELEKSLKDIGQLIEKYEYQIAEDNLGDVIQKAKRYHLNVIEQTAKKTFREIKKIKNNKIKKNLQPSKTR